MILLKGLPCYHQDGVVQYHHPSCSTMYVSGAAEAMKTCSGMGV